MRNLVYFTTAALLVNPWSLFAATLYVWPGSTNATSPYSDWNTASTNIQDAVDAAEPGDLILVTNGVYNTGGRVLLPPLTNRVAVTKPLLVQSVNGPLVTLIEGYDDPLNYSPSTRCVYLQAGATLSGFTLTNGVASPNPLFTTNSWDVDGGGVYSEAISGVISNCVLVRNSGVYGGGAYGATLFNCTLVDNSASLGGGGAALCTLNNCLLIQNHGAGATMSVLNNCTVSGNYVRNFHPLDIAGATSSTLTNCIVWGNQNNANYSNCVFSYCCAQPLPSGLKNISVSPQFLPAGNGQLQSNSPCINAGNNTAAATTVDLDGNPRIVGDTVDLGAYEFQRPASLISYAWLQDYRLPTDGSADFLDSDNDGMSNWQEWVCGTDPTNSQSALKILWVAHTATNNTVDWQSATGVNYLLERSTNLLEGFQALPVNIAGHGGTSRFTDTNTSGFEKTFYRVRVQK